MTTPAFSLTITCLDNNEHVEFQHSSFICMNRQTIFDMASQLGFTIKDEVTLTTSDYQAYKDLLFFITSLERCVFPITVKGEEIALFKKISVMADHWELISERAKELKGIPNLSGGFEFKDLIEASYFMDYLKSITLLETYKN